MEDVLDVYTRPYGSVRPLVYLDETSKHLLAFGTRLDVILAGYRRGVSVARNLQNGALPRCISPFEPHISTAAALLQDCRAASPDCSAIAATGYTLRAGQFTPRTRVSDKDETPISQSSQNHRHMRAMGSHHLPRLIRQPRRPPFRTNC